MPPFTRLVRVAPARGERAQRAGERALRVRNVAQSVTVLARRLSHNGNGTPRERPTSSVSSTRRKMRPACARAALARAAPRCAPTPHLGQPRAAVAQVRHVVLKGRQLRTKRTT
jgi:hypothetical protein